MKPNNVILGALGGLAAGALLGVLFTPDKGSATRRKIAQKGKDLKDNVKEGLTGLITSAEEKYDAVTAKAQNVFHKNSSNL